MKNGLKGVTDATVFCKSMHDKNKNNQIVRSMKSYAAGGATEESSQGPIWPRSKRRKFVRNVKNFFKGNLPQASSPKKKTSNCGGGICWN